MTKSTKRQIRMDLDPELHRRLRILTAQMDVTIRAAIRQAITEWVNRGAAELPTETKAA